jgi:SMI1/KNR4 family protein SUKH-1
VDPAEMKRLVTGLEFRPPADDAMVSSGESQMGRRLPVDYIQFLKIGNGGEGFVGSAYAILWGADELSSMNRSYEVEEYAPGLLIFGTDGGGEAYGFDTRSPDWPVVQVPFIGMAWDLARPMGASFGEFLRCLHERGK